MTVGDGSDIIRTVTTPHTIPVLTVSGTHREVGAQIGETCADTILEAVAFDADIPEGRSRAEQLELADRYREITAAAYPWYTEELEGAAEAAGVDPLELFACAVEEIWYVPHARKLEGRCSDLVAVPPATADGRVLVAHNNDMSRKYQEQLVAIEWRIEGEPAVFSIGNGIWISVGWNDAGLSFTGNELAPLDERIGVPREIQFRAMLRQPTLDMAIGEALRHDRASSYNNVVVSGSGEAIDVEGSATDAELIEPDDRGHLVHTNHYACERMLRYEGDPDYVTSSSARYDRARELLEGADPGTVTPAMLRTFLSDHQGSPDSLCRHPEWSEGSSTTATAFWCIADVREMSMRFGRGNPCDSVEQQHRLVPAAAALG
jgi:isopenicillin-N N-acyltransferase like protein